jgi:hypothetical protein
MFVFFLGQFQQMNPASAFGKSLPDGPDLPMGYNPNSPSYHLRNQIAKKANGFPFAFRVP